MKLKFPVIFLDNPVFNRVTRLSLRTYKFFIILSLIQVISLIVMITYLKVSDIYTVKGITTYNRVCFYIFIFTELLVLCYVVPSWTLFAFPKEKQNKTYEFLKLTRLRSTEIVMGYLMAALAVLALILITLLPFFLVIYNFGGISFSEFIFWQIVAGTVGLFIGMAGLYMSVIAQKLRNLTSGFYGIIGLSVLYLGVPFITLLTSRSYPKNALLNILNNAYEDILPGFIILLLLIILVLSSSFAAIFYATAQRIRNRYADDSKKIRLCFLLFFITIQFLLFSLYVDTIPGLHGINALQARKHINNYTVIFIHSIIIGLLTLAAIITGSSPYRHKPKFLWLRKTFASFSASNIPYIVLLVSLAWGIEVTICTINKTLTQQFSHQYIVSITAYYIVILCYLLFITQLSRIFEYLIKRLSLARLFVVVIVTATFGFNSNMGNSRLANKISQMLEYHNPAYIIKNFSRQVKGLNYSNIDYFIFPAPIYLFLFILTSIIVYHLVKYKNMGDHHKAIKETIKE